MGKQTNENDRMTWSPAECRTVTRVDVTDAVGWDRRKTLASLWQDHAPLPDDGLSEATYRALLAVALWGAESLWRHGETVDPPFAAVAHIKAEARAEGARDALNAAADDIDRLGFFIGPWLRERAAQHEEQS